MPLGEDRLGELQRFCACITGLLRVAVTDSCAAAWQQCVYRSVCPAISALLTIPVFEASIGGRPRGPRGRSDVALVDLASTVGVAFATAPDGTCRARAAAAARAIAAVAGTVAFTPQFVLALEAPRAPPPGAHAGPGAGGDGPRVENVLRELVWRLSASRPVRDTVEREFEAGAMSYTKIEKITTAAFGAPNCIKFAAIVSALVSMLDGGGALSVPTHLAVQVRALGAAGCAG